MAELTAVVSEFPVVPQRISPFPARLASGSALSGKKVFVPSGLTKFNLMLLFSLAVTRFPKMSCDETVIANLAAELLSRLACGAITPTFFTLYECSALGFVRTASEPLRVSVPLSN